jgi:hypothetical protein
MNAQTADLQTVVERLEKVERQSRALGKQNRRLKVGGVMALTLVAGAMLMGAAIPKSTDYSTSDFKFRSLQVRELIIVDEEQRSRAQLCTSDDASLLKFYDKQGTCGFVLLTADDGSGLILHDTKGRMRFALGTPEGKPNLEMYDEVGTLVWKAPLAR